MNKSIAQLRTVDGNITWTISVNGVMKVFTADKSHPSYNVLLKAFKEQDADLFVDNYDYVDSINNFVDVGQNSQTDEAVKFDAAKGTFTFCGYPLDNVVTNRILHLKSEGMPFLPMHEFLKNLMANSSKRSVEELYPFLEHGSMPITDDGCFLAYKTVVRYQGDDFVDVNGRTVTSGDLVDKYSRRVRNNIGDVVSMPRNMVDDDRERTCSHGYHVGALAYAGPGGWYNNSNDTVVIVKVNPKDAVSVPADHNAQKLRVCSYEVVSVYSQPLSHSLYTASGDEYSDYDDDFDLDDDDYDECFKPEYVVDDLQRGDEITFDYTNKEGVTKKHHCFVEAKLPRHLRCRLGESDPDYSDREYSTFSIEGIMNLDLME